MIKIWFYEFQHGRTMVFDESQLGSPKTATMWDNVTMVQNLVLAGGWLKVHEIAEIVAS